MALTERVEQRSRVPQVRRVEALGERGIYGGEEVDSSLAVSSTGPQTGEGDSGAQLPPDSALPLRSRQCFQEAPLTGRVSRLEASRMSPLMRCSSGSLERSPVRSPAARASRT